MLLKIRLFWARFSRQTSRIFGKDCLRIAGLRARFAPVSQPGEAVALFARYSELKMQYSLRYKGFA